MILVDTSAWFACAVTDDGYHRQALDWYSANDRPLVSTDYVMDEALTLVQARQGLSVACELGRDLFSERICRLEWVTKADVKRAWWVFESYNDKDWSFTDCVSKVVMERLGITTAFAFDKHFRQFGGIEVVP